MKFKSHWPIEGFRWSWLLKQIIHDILFLAQAAILFIEAKPYLAILLQGHLSNIPMKFK